MKILVIDDDPSVLRFIENALNRFGYTTVSHEDSQKGVEEYFNDKFDAVILDIYMSGINGLEALKEIKRKDKGANVIMLTGYADLETAQKAMRDGAYAFLTKPLSLDKLTEVLDLIKIELDK